MTTTKSDQEQYDALTTKEKYEVVLGVLQDFELTWPTTVDADFAAQLWAEYVNWTNDLGFTPRTNEDWCTVAPRIALYLVTATNPVEILAALNNSDRIAVYKENK